MIVSNIVHAPEIVQRFAEIAKSEPAIRHLYYRQSGPFPEFWVVTEPIDVEVEKRVRQIRHSLYELFPDARFELHLINPRLSESFELGVFVPEDAILVLMH